MLFQEGRKHYFLVTFPQEPGALRRFLDEILGPEDDITYFQYVKRSNREVGPAMVGVELGDPGSFPVTISSSWEVSYDADKQIYRVFGGKIEKFARRTNFDQFESVNRLRDIMRHYGIAHELMRQGATGDSLVQIGESTPFTLVEQ